MTAHAVAELRQGQHATDAAPGAPAPFRVAGRHRRVRESRRESHRPQSRRPQRRPGVRQVALDAVFLLAGTAGALAVAWLIFSTITGATIIVFMTGSMSPSIPAGGASISMPTAATDLRVGDIITASLDDNSLPVSHRIVSIAETGDAATREVVLKGDDNSTPDLFPYVVGEVPRVVMGGPGWGIALSTARSPLVIGSLTLGVAGLCLWAFWPERATDAGHPSHRTRTSDAP